MTNRRLQQSLTVPPIAPEKATEKSWRGQVQRLARALETTPADCRTHNKYMRGKVRPALACERKRPWLTVCREYDAARRGSSQSPDYCRAAEYRRPSLRGRQR